MSEFVMNENLESKRRQTRKGKGSIRSTRASRLGERDEHDVDRLGARRRARSEAGRKEEDGRSARVHQ